MQMNEHGGDIYANPGVKLDFSINTNPLGLPDEVRQALISHVDEYTCYPDPQCRELCTTIACHENVSEDMILCGNGAADLIYRLCYALKPRKALICAPTFSEYERALEQTECEIVYHALKSANQFELTAQIENQITSDIDILFLCHPNNPTGGLIPENLLERLLRRAGQNKTKVIVDECFLDFTDGISSKKYLKKIPELIVLKAFTKIYAMAGLRLGYVLTADAELLKKVNAAMQCWSVSVPAQIAGVAAIACEDWQKKARNLIEKERSFLYACFSELGIIVFPSHANYMLFRCKKPLYEPLLKRGILIRSCENFKGLDASYFRISVKTRYENIQLIQAIKEILNG